MQKRKILQAFVEKQTLFLCFFKKSSYNLYIFVTFIVENITQNFFSTNNPKINQRNSKLIDEP